MVVLYEFEGHIVVVIIDGLVDLVVDYNLILFVPHMQEDAALVPAFCFAHEVFAVLYCSEEYAYSRVEVVKSLHNVYFTMSATAA